MSAEQNDMPPSPDEVAVPQWAHDRAAARKAIAEAKVRLDEATAVYQAAEKLMADACKAQHDWEWHFLERAYKAAE